ncbi:MAG: COG1361 family protein, partial [Bellilinea sp.]
MKAKFLSIALLMILLLGVIATQPGRPVNAQTETDTPTGSAETLTEASPPAPTRPLLMIESYSIGADSITPGQRFDLTLRLSNISQHDTDFARNIVLSYSGADFLPVDTGGVRAIPEMDPEEKLNVVQPFIASSSLTGSRYGSITVNVSYTDLAGTAQYTEAFTITINLSQPAYTGGSARPTATPTAVSRPQLVVGSYDTDVDPLQPGSMFTLDLAVTNLGNADSRG